MPKGITTTAIIIIIACLVIAGLGGFFGWRAYQAKKEEAERLTKEPEEIEEEKPEKFDWKTYENSKVNFTFKYPDTWEIAEDYDYKGKRFIALQYDQDRITINEPQAGGSLWEDSEIKQVVQPDRLVENGTRIRSTALIKEERELKMVQSWLEKNGKQTWICLYTDRWLQIYDKIIDSFRYK